MHQEERKLKESNIVKKHLIILIIEVLLLWFLITLIILEIIRIFGGTSSVIDVTMTQKQNTINKESEMRAISDGNLVLVNDTYVYKIDDIEIIGVWKSTFPIWTGTQVHRGVLEYYNRKM